MSAFWQITSIPIGETRHWEIGLLDLWIHHGDGEWRVWHDTDPDATGEGNYVLDQPCEEPTGDPQRRFAFDSSGDELSLGPAFPDRPIVSYPGSPVSVPAKSEATFICGIPLALEVFAGRKEKEDSLVTLPLRHLSKTWFGTPLAGEPCYSASTGAVRDYRELAPNKYRALCPVHVSNRTKTDLPVERICIHVEHLQLFEGKDYLWANEVSVRKENETETSRVRYGSGPPSMDPEAELVLEAAVEPPSKSVFLKTFNHLRTVFSE